MRRLFPILLIALSCVACKNTKQKSSVLDIVANSRYGDTHACSIWANRYWEVFGHRGEMEFSALTLMISPATFDSIKQVVENEFGPHEYNKTNFPKEQITEEGFYWHLSKPCCDEVYYWSNDSLAVAWSLFEVEDNIGSAYLDIKRFSWKWVSDLENKNPLKDSTNYISVYFRFDTIINDFEVSGILYPYYSAKTGWSDIENGVRLFFYSHKTGKEYVWTDFDASCHCFRNVFMSKNVYDIVHSEGFSGFKNGDTYIFNYDTYQSVKAQNSFYPNAEYQFYDIDFDGESELLLNYFHGGPKGGLMSEPYEITDTALVPITPIGDSSVFSFDENTTIDPDYKTITKILYSGMCEWGTYCYQYDEKGDLYPLYSVDSYLNLTQDSIISDTTFYK